MADCLFEVGLEEIPARMIASAQAELAERLESLLAEARLLASRHAVASYSTPRRLAVCISGVLLRQSDVQEQLTGPSWKIAFKDDQPTAAAAAFAKKAGVEVPDLQKLATSKGEYVSATVHRSGLPASQVIAEQLPPALASISWAKSMYWRKGKPERFVRPLRWMLALLGEEVVPVEFGGIRAGHVTHGHRILHGDKPIPVPQPSAYLSVLESAYVLADVEARRQRIRKMLDAETRLQTSSVSGSRWREDHNLIDTVAHLTEWPSVIAGTFEREFLTLPEEVLVTVMRDHQKYFAIEDASGKLAATFLAVLNTEVDRVGADIIRHGNERVLRARFNDARFFWDTDHKIPLAERVEMLKAVTFQKDLGSYYRKTESNIRIAGTLADLLLSAGLSLDKSGLLTAARLAKTDLTAELVKEFTELQGIVGGLYARAQGHGEVVARAIYAQYTPASTGDVIPQTIEGQILGIADRINTIVDMFAIGLEPTGSKDPFALRRAAIGVIKILADSKLPLRLGQVIDAAIVAGERRDVVALKTRVAGFIEERLAFYLRDVRGFAPAIVTAELATSHNDESLSIRDSVTDAIGFAEDLSAMRGSADFVAICGAFKRIKNILRQARYKGEAEAGNVAPLMLQQPAEIALDARLNELRGKFQIMIAERRYRDALVLVASLRPQVDSFFESVMVMDPDPDVRKNRLALLAEILNYFSRIADFSELAVG
ncbi:MAG TPA: glycine--tRNA ligase subunit beta [Acidisarcina sp.]